MFKTNHIEGSVTTVYGEWAGPGIQNGVAISEIPQKMFFVFGVKITPPETDPVEPSYWIPYYEIASGNSRVWDLRQMQTYQIAIDFNRPQLATPELAKITEAVEAECPIAKLFGVSGVGEGVVWTAYYGVERLLFKVKGEKHSSSKVKTLAQADPEKMQSIYDFVDYAATVNRVDQAMKEVGFVVGTTLTKSNTPDVLRWIANDIITEESEILKASNIEWKDVAKEVSDRARRIFFEKLDNLTV